MEKLIGNWTDLEGETNSTLGFSNLQDSNEGLYRVRVSNDWGTIFSRGAKLETVHVPEIISQSPELDLLRPAASKTVMSVETGTNHPGKLRYFWKSDASTSAFANFSFFMGSSNILTLNSMECEAHDWVVVSNIAGLATSQVWTVSIIVPGESTGWGNDYYGQLTRMRSETNLVAVAAGGAHSLGLRENGTVIAWGNNLDGQTNIPTMGLSNVTAIAAGNAHSLALKEDGTVCAWGWNYYGQTNVPANVTNIAAIAAGGYHNIALRKNGTVTGWGNNSYGALNIPNDLSNVVAIAAGDGLSYALLSNGTVRSWGYGGFGAVTVPGDLSNVVQIAAGWTHLLALRADGTVTGLGWDSGGGETEPPAGLSNVLQITAGYMFSAALKNDGELLAWGRDNVGQTGASSYLDSKMISAGGFHCLVLEYHPLLNYPVDVKNDLLLIANSNSSDSTNLLNYYLAHRPGVSQANVIVSPMTAIPADTPFIWGMPGSAYYYSSVYGAYECFGSLTDFEGQLRDPVIAWLNGNPTKRPQYVVLFLDVPSRTTNRTASTSVLLRDAFPWRKPFITHINMGGLNDCTAYVDKLAAFGSNYSPGKVVINASSGGYGNSYYYFDDCLPTFPGRQAYPGAEARDALLAIGVSPGAMTYIDSLSHITNAANVAEYMTWGVHGGQGWDYANDGRVIFTDDSGWYAILTIESFNGTRIAWQGNFIDWFAANAFGGSNYGHTPVGAVSHVEEPGYPGVNDRALYFCLWAQRKYFSICAWASRRTIVFQAVGDPLVAK